MKQNLVQTEFPFLGTGFKQNMVTNVGRSGTKIDYV